ncbi:hypothetical protein OH77DRAFT_1525803 [Trametes cingulata]|nr:hypothetical protein OH77DRAFT_1525803 [Trametes cingulata]
MTHVSRAILQLTHRVLQELPPHLKASVDASALLQSFSYLDPETQQRVALDGWELAPGTSDFSEEFDCSRQDIQELWADAYRRKLRFFPELIGSGYWAKYMSKIPDPSHKDYGKGASSQKARQPARPERTGKKGRKRARDHDEMTTIGNKGRVNAVRAIKLNHPASPNQPRTRMRKRARHHSPLAEYDNDADEEDINEDTDNDRNPRPDHNKDEDDDNEDDKDEDDDDEDDNNEDDEDAAALLAPKARQRSAPVVTVTLITAPPDVDRLPPPSLASLLQ